MRNNLCSKIRRRGKIIGYYFGSRCTNLINIKVIYFFALNVFFFWSKLAKNSHCVVDCTNRDISPRDLYINILFTRAYCCTPRICFVVVVFLMVVLLTCRTQSLGYACVIYKAPLPHNRQEQENNSQKEKWVWHFEYEYWCDSKRQIMRR